MIIFIDRDGVINKDPGGWTKFNYVTEFEDLQILPGSLKALRILKDNGIRVIVVSNQAGVNKGYFTKKRLDEINYRMIEEIKRTGGAIEEVYYCIHKDEDNCNCRKPKTGMLDLAIKKHRIEPRNTYFIGDGKVDILAGKKAGLRTIFVLSGKTSLEDLKKWEIKPNYMFKDLLEAAEWLVAKTKRKFSRREKRGKREEIRAKRG